MSKNKNDELEIIFQDLEELKDASLSDHNAYFTAQDVILRIYDISTSCSEQPTIEEKMKIFLMMSDVTERISRFVDKYLLRFRFPWTEDEEITCKIHSGLQFLKDDYFDVICKDLNAQLKDKFNCLMWYMDYSEIEDCIKIWKKALYCYHPEKPENVPESHFWWYSDKIDYKNY
jgi:hypothetical protein